MKVYIAGKITDEPNYQLLFAQAEETLRGHGHKVMNPAILPPGFEHHEYMRVCYSMIDICDAVFFLDNWKDSTGAKMEHTYALQKGKGIVYGDPRLLKCAEFGR